VEVASTRAYEAEANPDNLFRHTVYRWCRGTARRTNTVFFDSELTRRSRFPERESGFSRRPAVECAAPSAAVQANQSAGQSGAAPEQKHHHDD
jgi:hypothetical protein